MPKKTNFEANGSKYYRVTATIGKNPDGSAKRKPFYGKSKKEAENKRDEYMANIDRGLSVDFDKVVFRDIFKLWFDEVLKPTLAQSSIQRYETDYRLRIKNCVLSDMKLTEIKSIHLQSYYNSIVEKYSANTAHNTNKLIKNFFKYCVKDNMIIKNPLDAVTLPKTESKTGDNKVLSQQDIDTLIQASSADGDLFIFVFALFTGLRLGEILALTHNDIDFENNIIKVSKSVTYLTIDGEYKPVVSTPKTNSSIRDVPILEQLKAPLLRHISNEKEKHFKLGVLFKNKNMLFSSEVCTYKDRQNVRKSLARTQKRLGMQVTTFHALRHSFCTLLAQKGVPLKTASVLMGHSNISVTAQIYTHVDNQELKKGIDKLSSLFDERTA